MRAAQLTALCEAEQTINAAHAAAERALAEAHAAGDELRRQAAAAGAAQVAALLLAAQGRAHVVVEEARAELTTLAVRVAEKILGAELRLRPEAVADVVASCLRACAARHRVVVRVHPADAPLVAPALPRLRALADVEALLVQPDEAVPRGGCVLETDCGQVDGRLETQLAAVEEALAR